MLAVDPRAPGVRVDSGFETGDTVSQFYDALLSKIIVAGADRPEAIARMEAALAQTVILGLTTNVAFLRAILAHPEFLAGAATTQFINENFDPWQAPALTLPDEVLIAAAMSDALAARDPGSGAVLASEGDPFSPWRRTDGFRVGGG
jgi:acetyl/propionyl-CoA carboxylase alpha subunit